MLSVELNVIFVEVPNVKLPVMLNEIVHAPSEVFAADVVFVKFALKTTWSLVNLLMVSVSSDVDRVTLLPAV